MAQYAYQEGTELPLSLDTSTFNSLENSGDYSSHVGVHHSSHEGRDEEEGGRGEEKKKKNILHPLGEKKRRDSHLFYVPPSKHVDINPQGTMPDFKRRSRAASLSDSGNDIRDPINVPISANTTTAAAPPPPPTQSTSEEEVEGWGSYILRGIYNGILNLGIAYYAAGGGFTGTKPSADVIDTVHRAQWEYKGGGQERITSYENESGFYAPPREPRERESRRKEKRPKKKREGTSEATEKKSEQRTDNADEGEPRAFLEREEMV